MSGPKGYGYTVDSAEQRNRRECAEVRGRCTVLRERARQAAHEVAALGGSPASVPAAVPAVDDRSALDATEARLLACVASLAEERDRLRVERRSASIARRLADLGAPELTLADARIEPSASSAAPAPAPDLRADLAAIVVKLAAIDDDAERGRLEQLAARAGRAISEGSAGAPVVLLRVSTEAAAALHAQREARLARSEAADAELTLGDASGPDADAVRSRLRSATTCADVERLRPLVDGVLAARRAEADRAFVVSQTAEVLTALGYEVESGFVESGVAGKKAFATRGDLPEYALQLRFVPGQDRVLARTVALADTDEDADVAAEDANCVQLDALQTGWAAAGVASTRDHEQPSGAIAMVHTAGRTIPSRARRAAPATTSRERPSEKGLR